MCRDCIHEVKNMKKYVTLLDEVCTGTDGHEDDLWARNELIRSGLSDLHTTLERLEKDLREELPEEERKQEEAEGVT